jgi:hypothetical protein
MDKRLVERAHGLLFRYGVALAAWRADKNDEDKSKAMESLQQEIIERLVRTYEAEESLPPIKEAKVTFDREKNLYVVTKENN